MIRARFRDTELEVGCSSTSLGTTPHIRFRSMNWGRTMNDSGDSNEKRDGLGQSTSISLGASRITSQVSSESSLSQIGDRTHPDISGMSPLGHAGGSALGCLRTKLGRRREHSEANPCPFNAFSGIRTMRSSHQQTGESTITNYNALTLPI